MGRSRMWVLWGFAAWTVLVWLTRIDNIWGDLLLSTNEKVARTLLALSFLGAAVALVVVGWRLRRDPPSTGDVVAVRIVAGWTTVVWVLRAVDIAFGDHDAAFIVVHVGLAVISIVLAVVSWRLVGPPPDRRSAAGAAAGDAEAGGAGFAVAPPPGPGPLGRSAGS